MGEPLVIVGGGMAAARLVHELTRRCLGRYDVVVVGYEPTRPYNRVLLSSLLAGDIEEEALDLAPRAWWSRHGVTSIQGVAATAIDRAAKCVTLANGASLPYSKLVLATGSRAILLPKPGMNLPGVITFREMADIDAMRASAPDSRAVVIGGGLLGIEAAYGLARLGRRVTLVHLMDRLMERQLDAPGAAMLKAALERKGIEVLLNADTAHIEGEARAEALVLTDGRRLPCDLVVCAVGIRPNAALGAGCGLESKRGLIVDNGLATSDQDIFALGECAEHRGVCYGLVEPAYEQAAVLARRLAGEAQAVYEGSILATNLKVSGVKVFSAGDFADGAGREQIVYEDPSAGLYKKFVLQNDRLIGAVLVGEAADALWYRDLIRDGAPLGGLRDGLAFGRSLAIKLAA